MLYRIVGVIPIRVATATCWSRRGHQRQNLKAFDNRVSPMVIEHKLLFRYCRTNLCGGDEEDAVPADNGEILRINAMVVGCRNAATFSHVFPAHLGHATGILQCSEQRRSLPDQSFRKLVSALGKHGNGLTQVMPSKPL